MLGEEERSDEEGSFSKASIPKRIAVVLAGGLVNILFGLLVYFILAVSTGNYISTTIDTIAPGYAAENAGIIQNDEITKINGKRMRLRSDIDKEIQRSNGNELVLTVIRNNKEEEIKLTPTFEENRYIIGVTFKIVENNFKNNVYYGFYDTVDFSTSIVENLKEMFSRKSKSRSTYGTCWNI